MERIYLELKNADQNVSASKDSCAIKCSFINNAVVEISSSSFKLFNARAALQFRKRGMLNIFHKFTKIEIIAKSEKMKIRYIFPALMVVLAWE